MQKNGDITRLARPSSSQALRQVGFIGNTPIDMAQQLVGVVEIRPQRLEEHHAYNIVRWCVVLFVPAVAARFSGVWFGIGGLPTDQKDGIHVIERCENFASGTNILIAMGALPTFANPVSGGVRAVDNRWTPFALQIFAGIWQGGDAAAITGSQIDLVLPAAATGDAPGTNIDFAMSQQFPTGNALIFWASTANVALSCVLKGYTVLPR